MDHRDRVAVEGRWYARFDQATMTAFVASEDDDGVETEVEVPCVFDVCDTCDGKGSHVNPSIDSHGITPEEFDEDPDFKESYFRGNYDVPCAECGGLRVVPVPGETLTDEMRKAIEAGHQRQRWNVEDERTCRMERGEY